MTTYWYRIDQIKLAPGYNQEALQKEASRMLGRPADNCRVVKESLDARKKHNIHHVIQAEVCLSQPLPEPLPKGVRAAEASAYHISGPPKLKAPGNERVVVVGAGPAGMFAALALAEAGVPTTLLERGKPVDTRMRDIGQLRSHGALDPESNVCFGEGGAGAYTDGKLYTRIKHPYVRWVMQRLVDFEAPEQILYKAHPHLGTDKLVRIVRRLREYLIEQGVDVRFQTRMERLIIKDGHLQGMELSNGEELLCSRVILGIGHSARDTLAAMVAAGVHIEPKPFAVGVRVEHPQEMINKAQHGQARNPILGAAAYSLTHQLEDQYMAQRGVYSFCMCPGGFIVPSPTEPGRMAVNGMSNANRSTPFANSGVVVQVTPEDLIRRGFEEGPLIGIAFQRQLEETVFKHTTQPYAAPAMRIDDFIARKATGRLAKTNFRPVAEPHDLWEMLPDWIAEALRQGLLGFDRKIRGYASGQGNILAVESRTSSPIRVTRGDDLMSVNVKGLYPVGEGAGYAGGIVSAAVDGLRAAEQIIDQF